MNNIFKIARLYFAAVVLWLSILNASAQNFFVEKIIDSAAPQRVWMKTIGDINNDKRIDIIAGGWDKGGIVAYLAPSWKKTIICDTLHVSTDAEIADVNNDGRNDIVVTVDKALIWLSAPLWKLHLIDSLDIHDLEVYDLNGDGLKDIVARNQGEWGYKGDTVFIYHQKPAGIFTKSSIPIPDGEGLKVADINNDGKMDIVVNRFWYQNTGDIHKWLPHQYTQTWNWKNTFVAVADVNNDKRPDILLSPSELEKNNYHLSWFEAPKDRAKLWKEHIIIDSVETVVHFIGAADFNLDGLMDIMTAAMEQGKDPDEVIVYQQIKNNRFKKTVISTGGSHSIRLYDFDGDGDMDAFGANHGGHIIKMWENQTIKK